MDITTRSVAFGDRTLTFELGKVAKQADGSTVVRLDDTMVLVTACASPDPDDQRRTQIRSRGR